jgi:hypothetical protein
LADNREIGVSGARLQGAVGFSCAIMRPPLLFEYADFAQEPI